VEDAYSHVRVRGEISGFKRASSGHLYMALKDQDALIDAVCWRGNAGKLDIRPEDGMEVIATGRHQAHRAQASEENHGASQGRRETDRSGDENNFEYRVGRDDCAERKSGVDRSRGGKRWRRRRSCRRGTRAQ